MSDVVAAGLWGAASGILSSILAYLGVRLTNSRTREATRDATTLEQRRDTIADRDTLIARLLGRVTELEARVEHLEQERQDEREEALLAIRARDAYIADLRHQIYKGGPPPPVPPPVPY